MRILPITTTNNNTQFKQLKIHRPEEWDIDVLEAVVNNKSVKDYAKHMAEKGKDLWLSSGMKPFPIVMALLEPKTRSIANASTKSELLENLDKFDYKTILEKEEAEKLAFDKTLPRRNSVFEKLDEFNKELGAIENENKPELEPVQKPKKKSFFKRLFNL